MESMENHNEAVDNVENPKGKKALKIISIILLALGLALQLYQLVSNITADNTRKAQIAMAQSNAVRYIRGKYGFDAETVDVPDGRYFEWYDKLLVKIKANGREFGVLSDMLK